MFGRNIKNLDFHRLWSSHSDPYCSQSLGNMFWRHSHNSFARSTPNGGRERSSLISGAFIFWKSIEINENQWFWCFSRSYGTRWYQTESRKRENIKMYFQTFSDTSETYVSEGKKYSRQSGVVYLLRAA